MKLTRVAACVMIALSTTALAPYAQTLKSVQAPAEFPPNAFTGKQYIDSDGCVFIRAGIGSNTSWVPRVTRDRKVICGQKPTFDPSQRVSGRAAPVSERVVQITLDRPAPVVTPQATRAAVKTTTVIAPKAQAVTTPQRTAQAAPVAVVKQPQVQAAQRVAVKPTPKPVSTRQVAVAQPRARTQPVCVGANVSASCVTRTAVPAEVTRRSGAPVTINPSASIAAVAGTSSQTRVLPRHVYEERLLARDVRVPKGYAPVWKDDRLNRQRAEQTLAGYGQTNLRWTKTVPRRLIERSTGRDVTAKLPLVYPYTDIARQEVELGKVSFVQKDGQLMKRIVRNKARAKATPAPKGRIATRSAPAAAPVKRNAKTTAPVEGRYVQAGIFGVPANAERAAQRLRAAGMPARIGSIRQGGRVLQMVVAGPFRADTAPNALRVVRAQGFGDAFIR